MSEGEVVPCRQCGGYRVKVRSRVLLTLRRRGKVTLLITLLTVTLVIAFRFRRCYSTHRAHQQRSSKVQYDRMLPLIFIGGVPGSGSSLLRLHLNDHPDIKCHGETRIIPRVLRMYNHWITDHKEHARLEEAGVTPEVLQAAISALLLEVLVLGGQTAHVCSQDPLTLHHALHLSQIFPRARFLWVVRDGSALVLSLISRQLQGAGRRLEDVDSEALRNLTTSMLDQWNAATSSMHGQCRRVGLDRCRAVRYEQLLLRPEAVLRQVLRFLNVSWDEAVMAHAGQARFSQYRMEAGIPLDQSSMSSWQADFSTDVLENMSLPAPSLDLMGFDPTH